MGLKSSRTKLTTFAQLVATLMFFLQKIDEMGQGIKPSLGGYLATNRNARH
jgi:hypothetical protein